MRGCFNFAWKSAAVFLVLFIVIAVIARPDDDSPRAAEPGPVATIEPTETMAEVEPTVEVATSTPFPLWYEGGTLHDATLAEWSNATDANRLATAADWTVIAFDGVPVLEIRIYANDLLICIDEIFDGYLERSSEGAPISDLAALCAIKLGATPQ